MMEVTRTTTATPAEVFAVLADGWVYPSWVVGASRMRAVDDDWPRAGARLHHSVGAWPAVIDDTTTVLAIEEPYRLTLQARGWPAGEARVDIRVSAQGAGSLVTITEDASKGPGTLIPQAIRQPPIAARNTETLRRLILIAEGRAGKTDPGARGS